MYTCRITDSTSLNLIDIANYFYELDITVYSHPNFMAYLVPCGYQILDVFYSEQLYLKRNIDYDNHGNGVWQITTGDSDLIVAISDKGMEYHEDLDSTKFVEGFDFYNGDNDPSPYGNDHHGMAMGGVIFGLHNNPTPDYPPDKSGDMNSIVGLAPDCRIMPIKVGQGEYLMNSVDSLAMSFIYAYQNGADVINCSWSYSGYQNDHLSAAIDSAYYYGRSGLGTTIVFASGNHLCCTNPGIPWPATKNTVLAVGAVYLDDSLTGYSNYDETLDIVAVSSKDRLYDSTGKVWTHDIMGSAGHNDTLMDENCPVGNNNVNYTCQAGMTSMAAAFTSGAAAMLLSRKWDLPVGYVHQVLKNSSDTVLNWGYINRPEEGYGYGRLNVLKALLAISRGDADCNGSVQILDISYLIEYLYQSGPAPEPDELMGDANCDGSVGILDITYLTNYLYHSGPPPPFVCYEY